MQIGDRVILGLGGTGGGYWCGACEYCLGGRPRLCRRTKGIVGTYSEEMRVNAKSMVVLPDSVDDLQVPLACGGPDTPSNMQWQTVEEAKAKDKVERIGCSSDIKK